MIVLRPPSVEDIAGALGGTFAVRDGETAEVERAYFDTFDALLRSTGRSLVWERGRLRLEERDTRVSVAGEVAPVEPGGPFLASALPPGELRDALHDAVEHRALLPLARVHAQTGAVRILDGSDKTVVRVEIESASLLTAARREPLSTRVRVRGIRGYDRQLERVHKALLGSLGLSGDALPLVDEATIAAGGRPEGTGSKVDVSLAASDRSDAAAVTVLRRLLEIIDANLDGTIHDTDSEFLHDYRVAVRRTRSVQRELRDVFPAEALARMRSEFKWLQRATGDARDLDVYVLGFDGLRELVGEATRHDLEPLLGVLRGRRLSARREMVRELRSERAARLRAAWQALLEELVELPGDARPDAARPIGSVSSERIRKVYRRMVRMGEAINAGSPPQDYHELRKKGKELRYLLELFGAPLHDADVVKPMIKTLKALQDVLGRHQDREVQMSMLRSLRAEVSALPGGAEALMAMGVLIERLDEDAAAARGEFAQVFAAFAAKRQQRLVKATFA
jgi:CHAD domain-containing protein